MDTFCHFRQSWFDKKYMEKMGARYPTFKTALNLLYQKDSHIIVETGCLRMRDDWGAGMSTLLFADFLAHYGGHLTTIDISRDNMAVAADVTREFRQYVTYVVDDSLKALAGMQEPIDLLYLDSMDCPIDGSSPLESQEHNLAELRTVEDLLQPGTILLLDDSDFSNGGKTLLTNEYLWQSGWRLLLHYQQTLWVKEP